MRDIFDLVERAVEQVFDYPYEESCYSLQFIRYVEEMMGPDFYGKKWSDDDREGRRVHWREIKKLELLAGPHGKTLFKAMQARKRKQCLILNCAS